jgi:hypothetical protein
LSAELLAGSLRQTVDYFDGHVHFVTFFYNSHPGS